MRTTPALSSQVVPLASQAPYHAASLCVSQLPAGAGCYCSGQQGLISILSCDTYHSSPGTVCLPSCHSEPLSALQATSAVSHHAVAPDPPFLHTHTAREGVQVLRGQIRLPDLSPPPRRWDLPPAFTISKTRPLQGGAEAQARGALSSIYSSLAGGAWVNASGWESASPVCSWFGVTCTLDTVVSLHMEANGLVGQVPDLDGLPGLVELSLDGNSVEMTVPQLLQSLQTLTGLKVLSMESNSLSGPLPDAWFPDTIRVPLLPYPVTQPVCVFDVLMMWALAFRCWILTGIVFKVPGCHRIWHSGPACPPACRPARCSQGRSHQAWAV